MAKTKTPRTTSPRSKKNGAETAVSAAPTNGVETSAIESAVLKAPVTIPEVSAPETASVPVKAEPRPVEVKSESMRKPSAEPRRVVIPINLEEEIRRRAYQLYEERGCTPGHENDDWLVAEREVLTRYTSQQYSA